MGDFQGQQVNLPEGNHYFYHYEPWLNPNELSHLTLAPSRRGPRPVFAALCFQEPPPQGDFCCDGTEDFGGFVWGENHETWWKNMDMTYEKWRTMWILPMKNGGQCNFLPMKNGGKCGFYL